ncbi:T9SS outer membrane translocon Sov/SprA [Aureispira anguillae]|uniref:Cell surface protein SprA n=1 Tax=Aureispira anguillae TaxID=2864201 RepID=A0A915YJY6_9BACT|nr:cell surface protein SprA [Aureispira anguillae]BDS14311.1 cell surface protein SprA [Aureispira anguillae]
MNFKTLNLCFLIVCTCAVAGWSTNYDALNYLEEDFWASPTFFMPDTLPPIQDRPDVDVSSKKNPFDLKDPKVIEKNVEYDAESNLYIITETIEGSNYRPPMYLTPDEYYKWRAAEEDNAYFKELSQMNKVGKVGGDPVTPYKDRISNSLVERLFCGSTIDVRPQGNIGLTFGFDHQRIANPILTEQQQNQGGFDFDMNIQLSVVGKIGQKLKLSFNYNTQATFDFDRQIKVEYLSDTECSEDDIIKKIEAGNVSFPLRSSLIQGRQNLFGFRTDLQFGRLKMSLVASQSQTKRKEIQIKGGSQLQDFEVTADNYDENRHFFLSHYNRATYEENLTSLPQINTLFNITKIEVWVTNDRNVTEGVRDIVGYADLGETDPTKMVSGNTYAPATAPEQGIDLRNNRLPDNDANGLYAQLLASENGSPSANARGLQTSISALQGAPFNMSDAEDFVKIRARKLAPSEFTFDPKLGFVSVNVSVKPTDVVAVAYQYTYNGKLYQVGEFAQDLPLNADTLNVMHLKLLKGVRTRVDLPIWDLMMKNIYSLGAYQINQEDFMLDVFYQDPGGGEKRFIPEGPVASKPLITMLNLDNLNRARDPIPDGQFDYVPGVTILPRNGRVIFPVLEPFGNSLAKEFYTTPNDPASLHPISQKYLYNQLYDSTITRAREFPEYNRYIIRGRYKSSVSSEISLGGFNIPKGSVVVTAGGRTLVEGTDYSIDYNLGRIKILNEAYLNSGQPVRVAFEDNSTFGFNQQGFFGARFDYFINKNFNIGATFLHLNERPFTQKVNYGDDPISNSIYGFDIQYSSEAPWLTRLIDKIPLISTKAMSNISFSAEFAHLIPGSPDVINQANDQGGVVYIDDFEGSTSNFNLSIPSLNWVLASTPRSDLPVPLFPEAKLSNDWEYNKNRAKISWYNLEPSLGGAGGSIYTREIQQQNVFKNVENTGLTYTGLRTFDLTYSPKERGPYNFDVNNLDPQTGEFTDPENRWGGVMRSLTNTDFEASNIEFVEMWVMSPFKEGRGGNGGELYIELGDVSEDILKDSRLFFENGIPDSNANTNTDETVWSRIPRTQAVTRAFDNDPAIRDQQDIGLDGYDDEGERKHYVDYLNALDNLVAAGQLDPTIVAQIKEDPANDNFRYYRDAFYDDPNNIPQGVNPILYRYQEYNNPEGNSSNDPNDNNQGISTSTNIPDTEDLNKDNTLNEQESYFRYRIPIQRENGDEMAFTQYTVDSVRMDYNDGTGQPESVYWYQLKIPVDQFTSRIGGIADFRAIRFMRMYMTGFEDDVTLRMARLDLIRNQWRRYQRSLVLPGLVIPPDDPNSTTFDVFAVNIEENGSKVPFNYVLPPGVSREQVIGAVTNARQNEQSQALRVCNLEDGDARGIYKIVNMDMRVYKRLKMFVHAEDIRGEQVNDPGDMTMFMRIGSDFENNYYEYEIPLTMSAESGGTADDTNIWLEANEFNFPLELLRQIKVDRETKGGSLSDIYELPDGNNFVRIKGNPTLGQVKSVMVGVRNRKDDGLARCAEIWVNELRLTGFDERGGFAGLARLDVQMADFGQLTASGSYQSIGFGSIDQSVGERSREELIQYDISGSLKLDKFFPEKWKLSIPFYAQYSQEISTPEYDPYQLDVPLQERLAAMADLRKRDSIRNAARTIRTISSFNFTNVRKGRTSKFIPLPTDISNFSFTYAQSSNVFRSPIIEREERTEHRGVLDYNYSPGLKPIYPFKKTIQKIKNRKTVKWLGLIREININPLPNSIGFRNELRRNFGETTYRFTDATSSTYYDKKFVWDRAYSLQWNIFKSLRFNYTANNNAIIDEPEGRVNTREKKDALWDNIKRFGRTKNYQHNISASYTLPLKYLPILDWVTVKAQYNASYSWTAAALGLDSLGNVIQNSQKRQLTGDFQFKKLYDKWKYLKKINTPKRPNAKKPEKIKLPEKKKYSPLSEIEDPEKRAEEKEKRKTERKEWRNKVQKIKERRQPSDAERALIRPLMLLQRARFTYNENFTTVLPGFVGTSKYIGQDYTGTSTNPGPRPGWDFIAGWQPSQTWLDNAANSGWITTNVYQNQPLIQTHTQTYSAKVTLEPFRGLKIDVDLDKSITENYQELFKVEDQFSNDQFSHLNGMQSGTVKMTYLPLATFFNKEGTKGLNSSVNFETFEKNRVIISQRKGTGTHDDTETNPGFTEGYGRYQQDVLIPAFLAAYTGRDANKIELGDIRNTAPMPNWKLTYNGLAKMPGLDKIFSSFSLTHGYKSNLTVNSFVTDLDYASTLAQTGTDGKDINSQNYYSSFEIPNLVISESFNPLIGLDMRFKNDLSLRFQYKTSRNLSMSFIDYQLSEQNTTDVTVGFGWKFKNFKPINLFKPKGEKNKPDSKLKMGEMDFNFDFGKTVAKDELNLKCDISFRDDKTVNHILDQDQSVATRGMKTIRISPSIEWIPNNRLTFRLFFDYTQTIPAVSTSFPITSLKGGLTIRFSLSQ